MGPDPSWVKLNSFFNSSYNTMASAVEAAGFTVANGSQVHTLLDSLPLNDDQFFSDAVIMGKAPNRNLIWGSFGPVVNGNVNWAYAYDYDSNWSYDNQAVGMNSVPSSGTQFADMNIFAFRNVAAVPEPATWAMMLVGFGMMGAAMRYRRRSTKAVYA